MGTQLDHDIQYPYVDSLHKRVSQELTSDRQTDNRSNRWNTPLSQHTALAGRVTGC